MKGKATKIFILLIIGLSISQSQSKYPADTILVSKNTPLIKKMGVLPIAGWQRISYNSDFFNCQFEPSCSNYGAQSIHKHGLILGAFMASDRVIRCNPTAFQYHLKAGGKYNQLNKKLVDPIQPNFKQMNNHSKAFLSAGLSVLVPGLGRAYTGSWIDGLLGFTLFYLTANTGYKAYQDNLPIKAPLFIGAAFIIYGGEIFGAYRSANNNSLTNNTTSL